MITRTTLYLSDAYQITAIVYDDARYEIVEVIRIPLTGRPVEVLFDDLDDELKEHLEHIIRQ